ncbi:membrane protein [Actinomyces sp. Chiba101]|uniref:hypothetical protein n=1 Tax=Actinomyces TaxID=1654 RepID=UPI000974E727|nr:MULTISPECIES: hypothetical protein [Actinomyces]BAW93717.1 membrane protein [Actinomyces sp. Chiba101]GAV93426.1 hypothetical protein ADENT20671_0169 [Actinomyces denticolens]SUU74672.1 Uncharacterised protein [Actinomyces denticolens]
MMPPTPVPGASGRAPGRSPQHPGRAGGAGGRRAGRRTAQTRRNGVVLAWLAAAGAVTVGVLAGPLAAWGTWLPLHILLLGGIGSAITTWSAHFADTLLHRPAWGGAALLDARLAAHGLGAIAVLTGITAGLDGLALAGAAVVIAQALLGAVAIIVQRRRAIAPRMGALALHYAVALVALATGALLGWLTSWAGERGGSGGTVSPRLVDALYIAHTTTMLLGFVGITVLGTLTVLWPTMLRTRMEPDAPRRAVRGLPALVVGTALVAGTGAWAPLGALGAATYLLGAASVLGPALRTARRVPPSSYATASTAAAVCWFLAGVVLLGIGIVGALADGTGGGGAAAQAAATRQAIHGLRLPLAAGFALQVLIGALSYLTPVMLGGGPAAARATNAILDRAASYRVTAANGGLLIALAPVLTTPVRLAGALLAGALAAAVPVGMVRCALELRPRGASDPARGPHRSSEAHPVPSRPVPAGAPTTGEHHDRRP